MTIRLEPGGKKMLRDDAERERRSTANTVEVLIRDHCKQKEIPIEASSSSQKGRGGNARTDETAKKISGKGRA
jgi:hypothetical protein